MSRLPLTLPSTLALPGSHCLPSVNPSVSRTLIKLSRSSLLLLVQEWLKPRNQSSCAPCLAGDELDDEDSLYPAAQTLDELRELYNELEKRKGAKREVVDRILEGDWRRGVSLQQLAMADMQYLLDHPTSQRWTALKLSRISRPSADDNGQDVEIAGMENSHLPRFHAPIFLQNLQKEISPLVKAHYHLTRAPSLPLALLRIYIHDSPYNSQTSLSSDVSKGATDASKIIYVAFPDNTPSIYVSLATIPGQTAGGDSKSLRKVVLDALPKAFSRPQERYTLKPTSLSAKSLSALVSVRGPGRGNAASGGWSIFAEGTVEPSPLAGSNSKPQPSTDDDEEKENTPFPHEAEIGKKRRGRPSDADPTHHVVKESLHTHKRRKMIAESRFGHSGLQGDGKGIERFDIRLEDPFPTEEIHSHEATQADTDPDTATSPPARAPTPAAAAASPPHLSPPSPSNSNPPPPPPHPWIPDIRLTFHGTHIFAGLRKLVESGVVDGEKMPGWMTGEEGVSVGVVRGGRIRGGKGEGEGVGG
ncbi:hypothetical protein MMC24_007268 [Lignoscripta atroalba]|nr:hypothetical protein [Lignoscripta atroalba]